MGVVSLIRRVTTPPTVVNAFESVPSYFGFNLTFPITVDASLIPSAGEYAAIYGPVGSISGLGTPIATLAWLGGIPPVGLSFGTVSFGVRTISGVPKDCILFTVV